MTGPCRPDCAEDRAPVPIPAPGSVGLRVVRAVCDVETTLRPDGLTDGLTGGTDGLADLLAEAFATAGSWQADALCAEVGGDFWFPEKGESTREAKAVCARCPVRAQCLQYALDGDERFGVWGGLSERERRRLRRTTSVDVDEGDDVVDLGDDVGDGCVAVAS